MPQIAEAVLEAAGIGGWELDVVIGSLTWTAVTFRIFELEPPHAPPLADALKFYPAAARPLVQAAIQAAIDSGTKWDIETPLVTARGRHRWVRSQGLAVRESGQTVRIVGAIQDVTDRHEQTARTERLTLIAAQMTNIVITTDREGRIDWVNGALTRLTGHTLKKAIGRKPAELLHGPLTDPATIRQMLRGIEGGTGFDVEVVNYSKAGLPCWMAVTCSPLRAADGTVTGFIAVQVDISARRAAEDAARAQATERERAEQLLRDVLETLPISVSVFDAENRFVMVNRAYREMFPIVSGFLIAGQTLEALMRLGVEHGQYGDVPADNAGREAWIARHMAYFRSSAGIARTLTMADGRVMQVRERRSENGTLVSVRTDITDLKLAEARASTEAATNARIQALLHDVLEAMPSAVVAYGPDERVILANRSLGEMAPMLTGVTDVAMRLADVLRLGADGGYFADLPAAPTEQETWLADLLAFFRHGGGLPRTLRVSEGRSVQVRSRRSASGNLVVVSTDITDLVAAQALLRDVMDALPNAVIAYDNDEHVILFNRAHEEMAPSASSFVVAGGTLGGAVRQALELGYFADAPAAPAEREAWLGLYLSYLRHSGGLPRTTHLANGHAVQVRTLRSQTGNLVIVRSDITDLLAAQALLRDVMDALPCAVVAFDRDERIVLTNSANAELNPPGISFANAGNRLEDGVRQAVAHGYFADAPAAPAAREAWIETYISHLRQSGGIPRAMHLSNGQVVQVRTLRSETGNLVVVRNDITELLAAQAMLRDVLDAIPNSVTAYDSDDRLILFNPAYMQMVSASAEIVAPGERYEDILRHSVGLGTYPAAGKTPEARDAWIAEQVAHHHVPGAARILRMADGRTFLGLERRSDSGTLVSVRTDITAQTQTEALLRDILEALPNAVIAYDRDERLVLWNRAAVEMMPDSVAFAVVGRTPEEMLRLSITTGAYAGIGTTEADSDRWMAAKLAAYRAGTGSRTLRMRDGRFLTALERRSESGNLVCVRTDTTDLTRAEQHLRWQAERDPLTKLHNRNFFRTALDQALAPVAAGTEAGPARHLLKFPLQDKAAGGVLLLIDIDYFKTINDTLGHDMGDALLVEIAARLRLYLRDGGEGAARLGGDEFGVVISGLTDPIAVLSRVDGLHTALSAPAELGGRRMPVGISMGATIFPADGTDATKLLKNADLALYESKRNGRGRWSPFRLEQATALERHIRMADALRVALSGRMFTIAFQPKRRLRDGVHAGFEALARWHDGTNWVRPCDFIPVAEETGLIRPLGRAIMSAALARIREIRDQGFEPGRVAVNVTGPQLLDPHFKEQTLAALLRHGLAPADLELELTGAELFGRASERIDTVLREVSKLGITLALDNFGTGDASLAHLTRLPIDHLKIDRSFVEGIGSIGPGGVIARTVISLARSLGMESVAKGVETAGQMAFLAAAGCDVVQGYLISPPLLTTAEAQAYLA